MLGKLKRELKLIGVAGLIVFFWHDGQIISASLLSRRSGMNKYADECVHVRVHVRSCASVGTPGETEIVEEMWEKLSVTPL